MIFIVTKNRARRKYADDWPALVADFTEATRAEPGCLFFDWYRSVEDPNVYVLVEAFVDRAAGEAHVSSEHFRKAGTVLSELLAAVPEIINVEVPDGWSQVSEQPRTLDSSRPSGASGRVARVSVPCPRDCGGARR